VFVNVYVTHCKYFNLVYIFQDGSQAIKDALRLNWL